MPWHAAQPGVGLQRDDRGPHVARQPDRQRVAVGRRLVGDAPMACMRRAGDPRNERPGALAWCRSLGHRGSVGPRPLDNRQCLYIPCSRGGPVKSSTVNISFNDELLRQIDAVAREESRSRSELIREAARSYIEKRARWAQLFEFTNRHVRRIKLTRADLEAEIAAHRRSRR